MTMKPINTLPSFFNLTPVEQKSEDYKDSESYKIIINSNNKNKTYTCISQKTLREVFNFIYDSTLLKERGTKVRIFPVFGIKITLDYKVKPDSEDQKWNPYVFDSDLTIMVEEYKPSKLSKKIDDEYDDKYTDRELFEQEQIRNLHFPKTPNPDGFIKTLEDLIEEIKKRG